MIELIERKPDKPLFGLFKSTSGTKVWRLICDVCGKTSCITRNYYTYGFGDPGLLSEAWINSCGLQVIEYGEINVRKLLVCVNHRDAEIKETIKQLM